MKATDFSGDQVLSSVPAYPGTGNGAFKFAMGGSNQVFVSVNTTGSAHNFAGCPAQTVNTVYELELDWDGTTYRVWQGVPGGTAVMCDSYTSSSPLAMSKFEEMLLPDGGPTQFWPDGSSNTSNAFDGDIDSIRFQSVSEHSTSYTAPNTKFSADYATLLLENFVSSLDGTQLASTTTGGVASGNVYFTILGAYSIGYVAGDNLHDLELCSIANGNGVGIPLSGLYSGVETDRGGRICRAPIPLIWERNLARTFMPS